MTNKVEETTTKKSDDNRFIKPGSNNRNIN